MKIRDYYRDLGKSTAILSVKQGLNSGFLCTFI